MMVIDEIFRMGLKHIKSGFPCEDFAISGYMDNIKHGYIAISDGCSGSNGMTDIGARLWCMAYLNTLKKSNIDELFLDEDFVMRIMNEFHKITMLPNRYDETASLLMLLANENNIQFLIFGDGGYAIEKNDGTIELVEFSWYKNKPYYPIFKLEEDKRDNSELMKYFREKDIPIMKKETKIFKKKKKGLSQYTYDMIDKNIKGYFFEDVEFGYNKIISVKKEEVKSISVFSDGLWTVQKESLNNIVEEIIETKENKEYGFLKSKIVPIFENWHKTNKYPLDDFSMGKIIF